MTTKTEQNQGYTVEQSYEDLIAGLELGLFELRSRLQAGLKELSKSEMERALKAIITYPDPIKVMSEREESFLKTLLGLRGYQLQLEINALAQAQEEQHNNQEQGEVQNGES